MVMCCVAVNNMTHLLILTQSGGTMEDMLFFTSMRNWAEERQRRKCQSKEIPVKYSSLYFFVKGTLTG